MILVLGRYAFLTSLLAFSALSVLVRSQAPNDAHTQCTQDPVPDDVVRLLDSTWYRTLFFGNPFIDSAGWTATPVDSVSAGFEFSL